MLCSEGRTRSCPATASPKASCAGQRALSTSGGPHPAPNDGPKEGSSILGTRLLGLGHGRRAMGTQGERGVTITAPAFGHGAASLPGFSFRGWVFPTPVPSQTPRSGLEERVPRSQRCPSADTNQATSILGTRPPGHPRRFSGGGTEKKNSFRVFLRSVPPPGAQEGGDGEGSFCFFWVLVSENPVRGRGGFPGCQPSCPSGCPAVREPCCCLGLGSN